MSGVKKGLIFIVLPILVVDILVSERNVWPIWNWKSSSSEGCEMLMVYSF